MRVATVILAFSSCSAFRETSQGLVQTQWSESASLSWSRGQGDVVRKAIPQFDKLQDWANTCYKENGKSEALKTCLENDVEELVQGLATFEVETYMGYEPQHRQKEDYTRFDLEWKHAKIQASVFVKLKSYSERVKIIEEAIEAEPQPPRFPESASLSYFGGQGDVVRKTIPNFYKLQDWANTCYKENGKSWALKTCLENDVEELVQGLATFEVETYMGYEPQHRQKEDYTRFDLEWKHAKIQASVFVKLKSYSERVKIIEEAIEAEPQPPRFPESASLSYFGGQGDIVRKTIPNFYKLQDWANTCYKENGKSWALKTCLENDVEELVQGLATFEVETYMGYEPQHRQKEDYTRFDLEWKHAKIQASVFVKLKSYSERVKIIEEAIEAEPQPPRFPESASLSYFGGQGDVVRKTIPNFYKLQDWANTCYKENGKSRALKTCLENDVEELVQGLATFEVETYMGYEPQRRQKEDYTRFDLEWKHAKIQASVFVKLKSQ
eukprot:Skav209077  [mRNA]  locus=scaffold207:162515:164005:- [translate_table: standard]